MQRDNITIQRGKPVQVVKRNLTRYVPAVD